MFRRRFLALIPGSAGLISLGCWASADPADPNNRRNGPELAIQSSPLKPQVADRVEGEQLVGPPEPPKLPQGSSEREVAGVSRWKAALPPAPDTWTPVFEAGPLQPPLQSKWAVLATQHLRPIYDHKRRELVVGRVREGVALPGNPSSVPCSYGKRSGHFFDLAEGDARVCDASGLQVVRVDKLVQESRRPLPRVERALPHPYAKVATAGLPLLRELPLAGQTGDSPPKELLVEHADGAYWLALDKKLPAEGGGQYWRTVAGDFVQDGHFEERSMPAFYGEALDGEQSLPLAFAHLEAGADPQCARDGEFHACGQLPRHSRFHVAREQDGYVYSDEGWRVARDAVRVATKHEMPKTRFRSVRWVHFNLDEQAMVAYEGPRPVYATLFSSGKGPKHQTPEGTWRITRKYLTKTMSGPDEDVGRYHIEDIPWTMYYKGGYAVHGAYWHQEFGNVRSHGCTNLAPADARWLFYWSQPQLPVGWHAHFRMKDATWFHFTRNGVKAAAG